MREIPVPCRWFSPCRLPACLPDGRTDGRTRRTPFYISNTTPHPQEEAAADLLLLEGEDEEARDAFTAEEVFELIRNLNDPEHPLTLEQLKVATVRA